MAIVAQVLRRGPRDAARSGLLLHTGSAMEWIAPAVLAVTPWRVP